MLINKPAFAFALDNLTNSGCSGWYVRRDGADDFLVLEYGDHELAITPSIERPDVEKAGFGVSKCGFNVKFDEPIEEAEEIVFKSALGEEVYRVSTGGSNYAPDALNKRLIRLVEPFVEMDIAKVRAAISENIIYDKYHKLFRQILADKSGDKLKTELVEILADMKTTLHLLCAAYLDYTRYREPDFLVSLPQFCPDVTTEFEIDMRGDITGSNWGEPQENGRWTGDKARASVLLPNPGPGEYSFQIKIGDEGKAGDLKSLRVYANGAQVPITRSGETVPCTLSGEISLETSPFLALHFQFDSSDRQLPPDRKNPRSVLVKNLKFMKK